MKLIDFLWISVAEAYPQPPPIQNIDAQQAAYNFAMSPEQNIKLEPRGQYDNQFTRYL